MDKKLIEFVKDCIKNAKENGDQPERMTPLELATEIYDYVDTEYSIIELKHAIIKIRKNQ